MLAKLKKIKEYGLKGSLQRVKKKVLDRYYLIKSRNEAVWRNPDENELAGIEKQFVDRGIPLNNLTIDLNEFNRFKEEFDFGPDYFGGEWLPYYNEKLLEHFIAYKLAVLSLSCSNSTYLDIAAADSPWVGLLRKKGINAYAIDLQPCNEYFNSEYYKIMDATETTFDDYSIAAASLQCAFEMFTDDNDIKLIWEMARILNKDGRVIIVPLYLSTIYSGYSSPDFYYKKEFKPQGATVYLAPHKMMGIPFARFYNVETLEKRILHTIEEEQMMYNIYVLRNGQDIGGKIYCHFILEIIK